MWIVYLICAVLAAIRIGGDKSEIFQALAHLWVGALIGVWYIAPRLDVWQMRTGRRAGRLVVVLSVVEVVCLVASKFGV
jgi:Kef-type K+ transport system membrane component KefB